MDAYHGLEVFRHSLLFLILILSAYTDLSYGKLYNWYTIPGILLGILCNLLQGHLLFHSWWNPLVIQSLIGFGVGFLLFFFLFLSGGFGAGDMKLAGAIGAIMGWYFLLNALVYISLIGAIMAMAVLIWHGKLGWGIQESLRII
ncbi:MAG: prepilin peptidase, partial [Planctomycetota bacterium]